MLRTFCLVTLAAIAAAPAAAADLRATHEMIAMPPGKLHAIAFRPLKPKACVAAPINPAGSRIQPVRAGGRGCDHTATALRSERS